MKQNMGSAGSNNTVAAGNSNSYAVLYKGIFTCRWHYTINSSLYYFTTAALGGCPLYSLLGISTCTYSKKNIKQHHTSGMIQD